MPIEIRNDNYSVSDYSCKMTKRGINLDRKTLKKAKFLTADRIKIHYLPEIKGIILNKVRKSEDGTYKLSRKNRAGGQIFCTKLAKDFFNMSPKKSSIKLIPVFIVPKFPLFELALLPVDIPWKTLIIKDSRHIGYIEDEIKSSSTFYQLLNSQGIPKFTGYGDFSYQMRCLEGHSVFPLKIRYICVDGVAGELITTLILGRLYPNREPIPEAIL